MAKLINLFTPNTSACGNNSDFVGTIKVVHTDKHVKYAIDDDAATYTYHAKLPSRLRGLSTTQLYNFLGDHFNKRCYCQHDCCGHYFGGVRDVYLRGRKLTFTAHYSRNI